MRTFLIAATLVLFSLTLAAAPASKYPSMRPGAKGKDTPREELSTSIPGIDSLGAVPSEIEVPSNGGTRKAHLQNTVFHREPPVHYVVSNRRDPFRALITDEKRGSETIVTDLLQAAGAVLTGVVWAEGQYLAMVRDKDGKTFFLREGDPIYMGRVLSVTQSQISMEVSDFGDYQRITLKVKG